MQSRPPARHAGLAARALTLIAGLAATGLPAVAQQGGLRVQPVVLPHSDMPAIRGFVPAGWQARGGLTWGDRCVTYGYNIDWRAAAPDGSAGIAFLPGLGWGLPEFFGCRQTSFQSLEAVLAAQAQSLWPGARMIDFRRRPDLVGGLQVPMPVPELSQRGEGMYMQTWIDAGEGLFAFAGPGGQPMRGSVLVGGSFSISEIRFDPPPGIAPDLLAMMPQIPPQVSAVGGTEWGFAAWAPEGALDFAAAEALRKSFVPLAEWARFIAEHRAVIDGQNAQGARDRARIQAEGSAAISAIISKGYSDRTASQDRMQRETVEAILGVETYSNTSGDPVQLDHTYKQAWELRDGTYFLTNDPSFNPYQTFGIDGTQLQAIP